MPTCKQCGDTFPNHVKINGEPKNLGSRKFCLTCSPPGRHNTRDLTATVGDARRCPCCDKLQPNSQYYQRRTPYGVRYYGYCKTCGRVRDRFLCFRFKLLCLKFKGTYKCIECGYDKHIGALEFHHRTRDDKKLGIAIHRRVRLTPLIERELDKCDVLCSNCHRERHDERGLVGLSHDELWELVAAQGGEKEASCVGA